MLGKDTGASAGTSRVEVQQEFLLSSLTYDFRLSVVHKLRAFINIDVEIIIISGVSFDHTWRKSRLMKVAMTW